MIDALYKGLIRPVLFRLDPERVHEWTVAWLGWISRNRWARSLLARWFCPPDLPVSLWGLRFPNPIGLAAGMDKDAVALPAWRMLGFGFIELGAVTRYPQPGNPKPRLFRIPSRNAIVNRMGLNNLGVEAFLQRLRRWRCEGLWPDHPVGVNIGKSQAVPLEKAAEDYALTCRLLGPYLDFFVINVSCPNQPGLRHLQEKEALREILQAVGESLRESVRRSPPNSCPGPTSSGSASVPTGKPLLVKISPDLTEEAIAEVVEVGLECGVTGWIATNTTVSRPDDPDPKVRRIYQEQGGLSGAPLRERSTEVIRILRRLVGDQMPIIGVGGVFSLEDAWQKIQAGATLIQVYTGLVYEGPRLPYRLVTGLRRRMEELGVSEWKELCRRLQRPS